MNPINILRKIKWEIYNWNKGRMLLNKMIKRVPTVYVFGAPNHSNLGDQAQTYCTILWIKQYYPNYEIVVMETPSVMSIFALNLYKIRNQIREEDMIFLHSGYHMTDIYLYEEQMNRKVISLFPENKIIILPQTILFKSDIEKNKTIKIYDSHNRILLLCRDQVSYSIAQKMFSKISIQCFPDIVTTMIGKYNFKYDKKGILFCVRNDVEAKYSKEKWKEIADALKNYGPIDFYDTTVDVLPEIISTDRKNVLEATWSKFAQYKLVITDRYHGTIFSMIACTPVIVLSSTDHKLESGVRWFPDSMQDRIAYVDNIEAVQIQAESMLSMPCKSYETCYFVDEYYDKLKGIIDEL